MRDTEKQLAYAQLARDTHERRQAGYQQELQSGPAATAEQQEMKTGDLFREAFGHKREAPHYAREEAPQERPWDAALRLADDDAPKPPEAPLAPLPVVITPAEETRARQSSLSAADLFQQMEQRLTVTPEQANVPADVEARRTFRELPGADRERLAALVEAQDYGLPGYFDGRNFGDDYRAVLVGAALAKRLQDARRLQPELSSADLLQQMLGQG